MLVYLHNTYQKQCYYLIPMGECDMKNGTATKKGSGRRHATNISYRKDKLQFRGCKFSKLLRRAAAKTLTMCNP